MSMNSKAKPASPQLNLALLDRARAELPQDQQQELALALVELLMNVAAPSAGTRSSTGGQNEFETHE
jgi:anti-sigma regulatory factor (Ser/Thr protein kinase)